MRKYLSRDDIGGESLDEIESQPRIDGAIDETNRDENGVAVAGNDHSHGQEDSSNGFDIDYFESNNDGDDDDGEDFEYDTYQLDTAECKVFPSN